MIGVEKGGGRIGRANEKRGGEKRGGNDKG